MARFKRAYPGPPIIHQGPSPAPAAPVPGGYQARPFVARRLTQPRANTGSRGQVAAGFGAPFTVAVTLGAPQPAISIIIGGQRRTRAWTGCRPVAAGVYGPQPATGPPASVYRRPAPQIRRPSRTRALWHGTAAFPTPGVASTAYQQPAPQVRHRTIARAWIGVSTAAGGVASHAVTPLPLSTALGVQRSWITRSRLPARAVTGPGGTAAGITAPAGAAPYLTGVITTHDGDGTVTVWNITGTPAS